MTVFRGVVGARGARPDTKYFGPSASSLCAKAALRAKAILPLFLKTDRLTNAAVREALGLSDRMTRVLLANWVKDGWLKVANASNRARAYGLSASYRQYLKPLSAMRKK